MTSKKADGKADLLKKIAKLESVNDQLVTEIRYLDGLMRRVGFSGGIETVKATAHEIIEKGYSKNSFKIQEEGLGQ